MVLETAQMLCTVINLRAGKQLTPYKNSHVNHPLTKWAQDRGNWSWLYDLGLALSAEFKYRRGKEHASYKVIRGLSKYRNRGPKDYRFISFHNSAANKRLNLDFKHLPPRDAYRQYLKARWHLQSITPRKNGKLYPPVWTKRKKPKWA